MAVQSRPAIALAAKLPSDWIVASAPNAEPRMLGGRECGDGGVLGGLGESDPEPGEGEADGEHARSRGR